MILSSASLFCSGLRLSLLSITSKMADLSPSAYQYSPRTKAMSSDHLIIRQIDLPQSQSLHDPTQQGNEFGICFGGIFSKKIGIGVVKDLPLPLWAFLTEMLADIIPFNWLRNELARFATIRAKVGVSSGRKATALSPLS